MKNYKELIDKYKVEIENNIISSKDELEEYRKQYFGAKGVLKQIFQELKQVPTEKRKEAGELLKGLKECAENNYELNMRKLL